MPDGLANSRLNRKIVNGLYVKCTRRRWKLDAETVSRSGHFQRHAGVTGRAKRPLAVDPWRRLLRNRERSITENATVLMIICKNKQHSCSRPARRRARRAMKGQKKPGPGPGLSWRSSSSLSPDRSRDLYAPSEYAHRQRCRLRYAESTLSRRLSRRRGRLHRS